MQRLVIAAMARPASTRIVDDAIVMMHGFEGRRPGIGIDADLPAFGGVEVLRLSGEIAKENMRRRQQPVIGDVDVPEEFPKASEQSDRQQAPAELRPLRLGQRRSVWRSKEEPNPGESATLPSPPILMLVADTKFRRICI